MIAPPRIAAWLLQSTLAASERDAVIGDLCEEFVSYVVPAQGAMRARWWYRWQVARSLAPLFLRSWERASLQRASTAIVGGAVMATLPGSVLLMLRTFVLQQVPLKTTSELSLAFAATLAVVVLGAGALGVTTAIRLLNSDSRQR